IGVSRDEDGRSSQTAGSQLVLHFETVHFWHRQVEKQARDDPRFTRLEKLLPGRKGTNPECRQPQRSCECFAERLVIVNDGNDWSVTHRCLLTRRAMWSTVGATSGAGVRRLKRSRAGGSNWATLSPDVTDFKRRFIVPHDPS